MARLEDDEASSLMKMVNLFLDCFPILTRALLTQVVYSVPGPCGMYRRPVPFGTANMRQTQTQVTAGELLAYLLTGEGQEQEVTYRPDGNYFTQWLAYHGEKPDCDSVAPEDLIPLPHHITNVLGSLSSQFPGLGEGIVLMGVPLPYHAAVTMCAAGRDATTSGATSAKTLRRWLYLPTADPTPLLCRSDVGDAMHRGEHRVFTLFDLLRGVCGDPYSATGKGSLLSWMPTLDAWGTVLFRSRSVQAPLNMPPISPWLPGTRHTEKIDAENP